MCCFLLTGGIIKNGREILFQVRICLRKSLAIMLCIKFESLDWISYCSRLLTLREVTIWTLVHGITILLLTYPSHDLCLSLYDSPTGYWLIDASVSCICWDCFRSCGLTNTHCECVGEVTIWPLVDMIKSLFWYKTFLKFGENTMV
jgi:hypothetical protein